MSTMQTDYAVAHSAGWDAGNRNARRDGREQWNDEDWNAAAATFAKVVGHLACGCPWTESGVHVVGCGEVTR